MVFASCYSVDRQHGMQEATGESDTVITVKRQKPWLLALSADDSGLKSIGQLQGTAALTIDNPLGLSDVFNVGYSHDLNSRESKYGTHGANASYSIPWGDWTFTASASRYNDHQQIAGAFSTLVSSGTSKTFDQKAQYQFYRNPRLARNDQVNRLIFLANRDLQE